MLEAKLVRGFQNEDGTLGMLQFKGIDHVPLFTCENPDRETDVDDIIDAGEYLVVPHSGPKYKKVWRIEGVPRRSAILFHAGNTEDDSLGCILVGLQAGFYKDKPAVFHSRDAIQTMRFIVGENSFKLKIIDGR